LIDHPAEESTEPGDLDLLNQTSIPRKEPLAVGDRVAYAVATGLGAGFVPVAPGTAGALEGVGICLAIQAFQPGPSSLLAFAIITIVLLMAGIWSSNRVCEITGLEDAHSIVMDEVSGQMIALAPLMFLPQISIRGVVVGFLLFRLFDIFKPYPIRKLEQLHGGLGVMADDALAGVYAAALLTLCVYFRLV
jgi:phosphatidylglycerophosphatase A